MANGVVVSRSCVADPTTVRSSRVNACSSSSWLSSAVPALLSGATLAVLFNPFDRALYLRVHHRRAFLHEANWKSPFQGFVNAAVYRTICSASYLLWQDRAQVFLESFVDRRSVASQFLVGLFAGTMNGILLNQLQLVKFRMWAEGRGSFPSVVQALFREGGCFIFLRGCGVGVARDSVFAITYEVLRRGGSPCDDDSGQGFVTNCAAACFASTASSPLNYCRNIIYGAPPGGSPVRLRTLLSYLWLDVQRSATYQDAWKTLNAKLNLGWGALRVGLGMAFAQGLFSTYKAALGATFPQVRLE